MAYTPPIANPARFLLPKTTNFVRFVIQQECDTDFWIYLETLAPAVLKLAFTVTFLDLNDIIRGSGENIAKNDLKSPRKRGGKMRRGVINNRPPQHVLKSAKGVQFLLRITEPIEKIGFRWLLFAATEQFFQDWQTLIVRSGACGLLPDRGPLTLTRGQVRQGILPGGQPIFCTTVQVNRSGWSHTSFTASLPDGQFMITVQCDVKGPSGGIDGMHIKVVSTIAFIDTVHEGPDQSAQDGETVSVMGTFFFKTPPFVGAVVRWELAGPAVPVGLDSDDAFMSITRIAGSVG